MYSKPAEMHFDLRDALNFLRLDDFPRGGVTPNLCVLQFLDFDLCLIMAGADVVEIKRNPFFL
jgi:hypothetical protein